MTVNQFTITVDSIIRSSLSPLSFFRTQQYHVNITSTINRTPATGIRILAKRGRGVPLKNGFDRYIRETIDKLREIINP